MVLVLAAGSTLGGALGPMLGQRHAHPDKGRRAREWRLRILISAISLAALGWELRP
jgi:hypothetical protein